MSHECRPDAQALRETFRTGRFTQQHSIALGWAFSGIRRKSVFPSLIPAVRLPILDLAG